MDRNTVGDYFEGLLLISLGILVFQGIAGLAVGIFSFVSWAWAVVFTSMPWINEDKFLWSSMRRHGLEVTIYYDI